MHTSNGFDHVCRFAGAGEGVVKYWCPSRCREIDKLMAPFLMMLGRRSVHAPRLSDSSETSEHHSHYLTTAASHLQLEQCSVVFPSCKCTPFSITSPCWTELSIGRATAACPRLLLPNSNASPVRAFRYRSLLHFT